MNVHTRVQTADMRKDGFGAHIRQRISSWVKTSVTQHTQTNTRADTHTSTGAYRRDMSDGDRARKRNGVPWRFGDTRMPAVVYLTVQVGMCACMSVFAGMDTCIWTESLV